MVANATIIIGVIMLLGKRSKLMCEVFWWLVMGKENLSFFPAKKLRDARWEVKTQTQDLT
jgi:hypothetical protein